MRGDFSLAAAAAELPDSLALLTEESAFTFSQLALRVAPFVEQLKNNQESMPLPLVAQPDLAALLKLYACLEVGRPILLLHPAWPKSRSDEAIARVEAMGPGFFTAEDRVILATSGTSGPPKLVLHTLTSLSAATAASHANLPLRKDDRWLLSLPFAHIGGLSVILRCLRARAAVALTTTQPEKMTEEQWSRLSPTLLSLVPTQLYRMLDGEKGPTSSVRAILLGGAAAPSGLRSEARRRGFPILCTYGMTEAGSQIATQAPSDWLSSPPSPAPSLETDVGRALSGFEAQVDAAGALEIRGDALYSCYLERGAKRREVDQWFATGDVGLIDADGRVTILGRADDLIQSGAELVSPHEVETALLEVPEILEASVVGLPDEVWGERVVAAVVLRAPSGASPRAFTEAESLSWRARLRHVLPAYALPKGFFELPELPTNDLGKLARSEVRQQLLRFLQKD